MKALISLMSVLGLACAATAAWGQDAAAAEALARKAGCLKCHAPEKKKDGPSMRDIAAKWKGKADAEQKLITHATTSPKVKIDGKEEEHEQLKASPEQVKNVIQWYLAH